MAQLMVARAWQLFAMLAVEMFCFGESQGKLRFIVELYLCVDLVFRRKASWLRVATWQERNEYILKTVTKIMEEQW